MEVFGGGARTRCFLASENAASSAPALPRSEEAQRFFEIATHSIRLSRVDLEKVPRGSSRSIASHRACAEHRDRSASTQCRSEVPSWSRRCLAGRRHHATTCHVLRRTHTGAPPASCIRGEETNNHLILISLTDRARAGTIPKTRRHLKSSSARRQGQRCLNPVSNFSEVGITCV